MRNHVFLRPDHTASDEEQKKLDELIQGFNLDLQFLAASGTDRALVMARQNEMNREVNETQQRINQQRQKEIQNLLDQMGQGGWQFVDETDFFSMPCCVHFIFAHYGTPREHKLVSNAGIMQECVTESKRLQGEHQQILSSSIGLAPELVQEQLAQWSAKGHDFMLALEIKLRDEMISAEEVKGWQLAGVIYQTWYVFTRNL